MTSGSDEASVAQPPPAEEWPSPAYSWYVVVVLSIAYTVSFIDRQILNLLVEPIKADLGISDTQVSLLQGLAFAVFYSLLGVLIARLADRSNRRNIIVVGMILWCIMTALCGLARNFLQLFLARVGVGVGEAALSPPAYSIIADYFPPHRLARATGIYSFGIYSGAGIAMLVGGAVIGTVATADNVVVPLVGELRPWQMAFIIVGLPGLMVAGLMMTVREPARRASANVACETQSSTNSGELRAYFESRKALFIALNAAFSLLGVVIIGILSWTPTMFIRVHGWSAAEIGLGYGLILLLLGTSGSFLGGVAADWLYRRGYKDATLRVAQTACLLALPFAVGMALASDSSHAIALLAATTFLLSAPVGLSAAALQLVTPNKLRAQVTAIYFLIVALIGTGLGPTAVALPTDYLFRDPAAVGKSLALVAAVMIPFGAICLWYARRALKNIFDAAPNGAG